MNVDASPCLCFMLHMNGTSRCFLCQIKCLFSKEAEKQSDKDMVILYTKIILLNC